MCEFRCCIAAVAGVALFWAPTAALTADLPVAQERAADLYSPVPLLERRGIGQNSIFVFAGRMSTSNFGSTLVANTFAIDTVFDNGPRWDNYIAGAAYQRDIYKLGYGISLGAEIGIADRFGKYQICCDTPVTVSGAVHSLEVWTGAVVKYHGLKIATLNITPSFVVGFSATTDSIGVELQRQIAYSGSARLLGYLGPELAFSSIDFPAWEAVVRVHHRSGAGGLLGNIREGSNAFVGGVRYHH